jgi:lysophospholipase L1-like esterase
MRTDVTAINARTISVNGTPIAGSGAATGPYTTFDQLDADVVLYLNGTLIQGSPVPGQIVTQYGDVNVLSGVSQADVVRYGVASTPATSAATGPISPPRAGGGTPTPPSLIGFYLNGSTNSKLKAGFTRVQAGTGRAKWCVKGDSTSVGQWAVEDGQDGLTGSRPLRPAAKIAALYTAAGIPMLDNSVIGDPSFTAFNRGSLTETNRYDPRLSYKNFTSNGDNHFAGAGVLYIDSQGFMSLQLPNVDTFVMSVFGSGSPYPPTLLIDGAAPASGPTTLPGPAGPPYLLSATIKAASVGTRNGAMAEQGAGGANIRGMYGYNSQVPAWDILFHANGGATAASQASSNGQWYNQESLAFDAPDLTTINCGINDQNTNVPLSTYTSALQSMITQGKASGDVLLIAPHPFTPNAGTTNTQQQFNDAAKALAASNGIAFFSLYEYFGGAAAVPTISARTHDGVHPNAGLYADIATAMKQAIDMMRA